MCCFFCLQASWIAMMADLNDENESKIFQRHIAT
jgi:hypothetical protein